MESCRSSMHTIMAGTRTLDDMMTIWCNDGCNKLAVLLCCFSFNTILYARASVKR